MNSFSTWKNTQVELAKERRLHSANYLSIALDSLNKLQPFGGLTPQERETMMKIYSCMDNLRADLVNNG